MESSKAVGGVCLSFALLEERLAGLETMAAGEVMETPEGGRGLGRGRIRIVKDPLGSCRGSQTLRDQEHPKVIVMLLGARIFKATEKHPKVSKSL
jgi:hypothetical protein